MRGINFKYSCTQRKKVDLCQRKSWKGNELKWCLRKTVNWPLHITCLSKKQLPLGVNTGIMADFVKCKMIIHFLCTLSYDEMMTHFISAGIWLLEPNYSYFHCPENRSYIKVSFIKKIAMRRRSKVTSVLKIPKLGKNLSINVFKGFRLI